MPRPDLIDEIETLRDALRSWQDAAAKASKEVIAADERLRGAVEDGDALRQKMRDAAKALRDGAPAADVVRLLDHHANGGQ